MPYFILLNIWALWLRTISSRKKRSQDKGIYSGYYNILLMESSYMQVRSLKHF